jgi:hypothetical protein
VEGAQWCLPAGAGSTLGLIKCVTLFFLIKIPQGFSAVGPILKPFKNYSSPSHCILWINVSMYLPVFLVFASVVNDSDIENGK